MVKMQLEERRKQRIRDGYESRRSGQGAAASGAAGKGKKGRGKGKDDVKAQKGECYQWIKSGHCQKKDTDAGCPWNHPPDRRGTPKGKGKGGGKKGGGQGEQRGRTSERGNHGSRSSSARADASKDPARSQSTQRGYSPSGKKDRPLCREWSKARKEKGVGKCSKTNCDFWHPPVCKFHKMGKCSLGNNCIYGHPGRRTGAAGSDSEQAEAQKRAQQSEQDKLKAKKKKEEADKAAKSGNPKAKAKAKAKGKKQGGTIAFDIESEDDHDWHGEDVEE